MPRSVLKDVAAAATINRQFDDGVWVVVHAIGRRLRRTRVYCLSSGALSEMHLTAYSGRLRGLITVMATAMHRLAAPGSNDPTSQ